MLYIELPPGVDKENILQTEDGYHYFVFNETPVFLHDLAKTDSRSYDLEDESSNLLQLSISKNCPNADKFYVEYLPVKDGPAKWCQVVNGEEKNNFNRESATRNTAWVRTDRYHFLPQERKKQVDEARKEQKEDRYEKGPKSV